MIALEGSGKWLGAILLGIIGGAFVVGCIIALVDFWAWVEWAWSQATW